MFLRREHLAALVVAVSLAAVSEPARAQTTQTYFTAQHTIHFSAGTDQDRKVLSAIPSARDILAQGLVKYRWLGKQIVELTGAAAARPHEPTAHSWRH